MSTSASSRREVAAGLYWQSGYTQAHVGITVVKVRVKVRVISA